MGRIVSLLFMKDKLKQNLKIFDIKVSVYSYQDSHFFLPLVDPPSLSLSIYLSILQIELYMLHPVGVENVLLRSRAFYHFSNTSCVNDFSI